MNACCTRTIGVQLPPELTGKPARTWPPHGAAIMDLLLFRVLDGLLWTSTSRALVSGKHASNRPDDPLSRAFDTHESARLFFSQIGLANAELFIMIDSDGDGQVHIPLHPSPLADVASYQKMLWSRTN